MAPPRGLRTWLRLASRVRRIGAASEPETEPRPGGDVAEPRPDGPLIWVHARHEREARWRGAFLAELEDERGEDVTLLLTTEEAGDSIGPGLTTRAPEDSGRAAERFLDHWRPDMAVVLNAPSRPVLITAAAERDVPLVLVSTRLPEATGRRAPFLSGAVMTCFGRGLAASNADAERLRRDGMAPERIDVTGPLLDTAVPAPCDPDDHDALRKRLGNRPVWMAAHVGAADIDAVCKAHAEVRRRSHRLLLLVVPAPGADLAVRAALEDGGWFVGDETAAGLSDPATEAVVLDGSEMGLWYRAAPITFLGGTFSGVDAADPFGPALLGSAVIHGPQTAPHQERFRRLGDAGGALRLGGPGDLGRALTILLSPDRAAEVAHAGWSVTSETAPVMNRLVTLANLALDGEAVR